MINQLILTALLISTSASAAEFNPFDFNDPTQQRHHGSLMMPFAMSMTMYAIGASPEAAGVIGFGTTALAEHLMHKGRHGLTRSELQMMAIGTGSAYLLQKVMQHYGIESSMRLQFMNDGAVGVSYSRRF